ncbi:MAG: hypothetical protein ACFFD2_09900 [Promethearchaeota archaeon]
MKCNQKIIFAISIIIAVFLCSPVVIRALTAPFTAPAGYYDVQIIMPSGVKKAKITYTATGIIDVFVTDDSDDALFYISSGIVPNDVLANHTGSSGTLCVSYPDPEDVYYLILGNYGGSSTVTGETEVGLGCGIPGFEILFVFCALLAAFGILWAKKKLNF